MRISPNQVLNLDSAIQALQDAVKLRPDWAAAHSELGMLYVETEEPKMALEEYAIPDDWSRNGWLNNTEGPGRTLIPKYSLKTNQYGTIDNEEDMNKALQTIWLNADLHLTKLAELLSKS